ncbi:type II secretion system protein [uncultured Mitsuokella sp.]|jgi:type II secretory pathway pseudopilin PulG|uniref:type II secretion system protein n=1 Tax=uncultured Mitsuokella sp. TaxID=453120 RepID=UPI00266F395E|nr:type II secretion system protein [uncultured Mitsuokella sp.]
MRKRQKERGFFLLETIVLAGMLVVMTSGLLLYRQGLHLNEQARFEAAAVSLAESELAYVQYYAVAKQENFAVGSSTRSEHVPFSTNPAEGGADFTLSEEIERLEQETGLTDKNAASAYLATVRVSWQDWRLRERSVTLQRVICP